MTFGSLLHLRKKVFCIESQNTCRASTASRLPVYLDAVSPSIWSLIETSLQESFLVWVSAHIPRERRMNTARRLGRNSLECGVTSCDRSPYTLLSYVEACLAQHLIARHNTCLGLLTWSLADVCVVAFRGGAMLRTEQIVPMTADSCFLFSCCVQWLLA